MPKVKKSVSKYAPLDQLLRMDFTQLRAKECNGGHYATNTAIKIFIENLNAFFSQFDQTRPSADDIYNYQSYMQRIIRKINQIEHAYYLEKYTLEDPRNAPIMAYNTLLNNAEALPTRLKNWAIPSTLENTQPNAKALSTAIKYLKQWTRFINAPNSINRDQHRFFQGSADTTLVSNNVPTAQEDRGTYYTK